MQLGIVSHMSYISRDIHTRQCSCTVCATLGCNCHSPAHTGTVTTKTLRCQFCVCVFFHNAAMSHVRTTERMSSFTLTLTCGSQISTCEHKHTWKKLEKCNLNGVFFAKECVLHTTFLTSAGSRYFEGVRDDVSIIANTHNQLLFETLNLWTRQHVNSLPIWEERFPRRQAMTEEELFCSREFRCWCSATTLYCYMTPCQPLAARTDDLYTS